jgi:hypothetical protein
MSRLNASFAGSLTGAGELLFVPIAHAQRASIRPSQQLPMPPNTSASNPYNWRFVADYTLT